MILNYRIVSLVFLVTGFLVGCTQESMVSSFPAEKTPMLILTKTATRIAATDASTATVVMPTPTEVSILKTATPSSPEGEFDYDQTSTPEPFNYTDLPGLEDWTDWPELPVLSEEAIAIYQKGILLGNDPHAFSVFGDCQSLPDAFWGRYDDPEYALPVELAEYQDVVQWYSGSFDRESVTVKKGTTTAAILWAGWLDGEDHPCEYGETPLACELRIHNPSIVIISLGTHWELRNDLYLRKIVEQLIERGVLPIISTKADHREGEAWINQEMIAIANEYQLPVWNFWAAVQFLENHGMKEGDPMYMTDEGLEMQRLSGLKMLDTVWKILENGD